jgi:hypothetical protein
MDGSRLQLSIRAKRALISYAVNNNTFESLLVTGCTNKLNILTIARSAHTVFVCFVFA